MLASLILLATAAGPALAQTRAKSYTGWDCCKPICSAAAFNQTLLSTRGVVKACDKNSNPFELQAGMWAASGCMGGTAYTCNDFQPVPVSDDLSYGFAYLISDAQVETHPNCCKCFEINWLSGGAAGKRMIAQVITPGGSGGDIKRGDMIILTPGGGLGPLNQGCPAQYGRSVDWGSNNGGFKDRSGCEKLPARLQGGCYWRFNWARGEVNGWDISYQQVSCPSRLTSISGCQA